MNKFLGKYFNFKNFVIFICLSLVFAMFFNYYFFPQTPPIRNGGLTRKQAEIVVKNTVSSEKVVKLTVEVAESPQEQALGLSNRAMLENGFGMYFVLPMRDFSSFWMKEMRFPIDIIWIDREIIVGIDKNCPIPKDPNNIPTFRSSQEVTNVLEVDAGFSDQNNLKVGDTIVLR